MPIQSKVVSSVIKSRIVPSKRIVADTITAGQTTNISLADINEINLTGLSDGCIFIYDENTQKFVVTRFINNPNLTMFGGTF